MCVGVEAWVKMMSGTLQVELPWSRFCPKKILEICCCFPLGSLFLLAEPNSGRIHLQNLPVERRWWLFYCSVSEGVHFELFCSYCTVFALHDFLFCRCKRQHIQALRDLFGEFWKAGILCHLSLPFLSRVRYLCASCTSVGGKLYSYDAVIIFFPPHHPYPCASFITNSKLLNSLITKWHEEQFVTSSLACTKILYFTSGLQCSLEFMLLNCFTTFPLFLP